MAFRPLSSSVHSMSLHSVLLLMLACDNIRSVVVPIAVAVVAGAIAVAAAVDVDPSHLPFVGLYSG